MTAQYKKKYVCPKCNLPINDTVFEKSFRESFRVFRKRLKALWRGKEYIKCKNCNSDLLIVGNQAFVSNDTLLDTVNCFNCGKLLDFNKCYKETEYMGAGYRFFCWQCFRKRMLNFVSVILFVIGAFYLIGYTVLFLIPRLNLNK